MRDEAVKAAELEAGPRMRKESGDRPGKFGKDWVHSDAIIYGTTNARLAPRLALRCLNRNLLKQELNFESSPALDIVEGTFRGSRGARFGKRQNVR